MGPFARFAFQGMLFVTKNATELSKVDPDEWIRQDYYFDQSIEWVGKIINHFF